MDIEQIGHVYEGLLDHTAVRSTEVVLGLRGTRDKEPEIPLEKLEEFRAAGEEKLLDFLKDETGRSKSALKKAYLNGNGDPQPSLVNKSPAMVSDHDLLIACRQDVRLVESLKPYAGLIREDDFGRPMVILPGCVYVTSGTTRRSTGTHYTPRSLTEPIVQHTLEPLVYIGPAEGTPKEQWKLKSAKEILALNVCDMTMGSGAFLVQACRYLSERLVEAWEYAESGQPGAFIVTPEGDLSTGLPTERLLPKDPAERLAIARRFVADRCLFGVDINLMAVEMAKLSLWLVTMQRDRPFTFLDHALKCGDSLLGISSFKQLETFSLDDTKDKQVLILSNYGELIRAAIAKRRELETLPSNDAGQIDAKRVLNNEAEDLLTRLKLAADLLVAAELAEGNEEQKEMARAGAHLKVSQLMAAPLQEFRQYAYAHLDGRHPFHWPLEFPEIFQNGGFDALVGNPPFMAARYLQGALGNSYTKFLIERNSRSGGQADLCAYFFRRAWILRKEMGIVGLLATNTISEGDTRAAGLEFILRYGGKIYCARKSFRWPGGASLHVSAVHCCSIQLMLTTTLDARQAVAIDSTLSPVTIVKTPVSLLANKGVAFKGTGLGGDWFVFGTSEANSVSRGEAESGIIKPYITGQELVSMPVVEPVRICVDFQDLDETEIRNRYPEFWRIVRERAFAVLGEEADQVHWWKHRRSAFHLYHRISELGVTQVVIKAQTSKAWAFVQCPAFWLFDQSVIVFVHRDAGNFAVLQSAVHEVWVERYSSTHETRVRYSPSDVFENFPLSSMEGELLTTGSRYSDYRCQLMLARQEGLTKIYNRFHDASESSQDIEDLRTLHVWMDQAVAAAYTWTDLDLEHGFHETKQGIRFTISEPARRTVLDRLFELNHQRYEEEVKAGLHDKKKKNDSQGKRGSKSKKASPDSQTLFAK